MIRTVIEAIDEPHSARIDQCTKPLMKASIEASAFVMMSADARAQEPLSGRQKTVLSQGDHEALRAALDEDITPTPPL